MSYRIKILFVAFVAVLLSGCTSYKNVPYFQNSEAVDLSQNVQPLYDARVMPKDLLVITVNCTDPNASAPFNLTIQTPQNVALHSSATSAPALQQYLVGNDGYIDFPVLGKIKVGGLTKNECEDMIRELLTPYIKERPIVTVRMSDFKVSVLGEVNHPGQFTISKEKVNVLEALALAGDMTVYGVRNDIKLIREDALGNRKIVVLNINDANIINSPYYQLQQNDVLYVRPNKVKAQNSDIGQSTSLWFSATSIFVSVASLLFNILKK